MRWPAFFWRMWMLCLTSAAALFAVYVVQSPLSRLAGALTRKTPAWWPLYTVLATLGYWASSRGSRAFRHHHDRTDRTDRPGGQVAVRSTHGSRDSLAVHRGQSQKPLYVSAVAIDRAEAALAIQRMHGPHRIPTLLKQVDRRCRDG